MITARCEMLLSPGTVISRSIRGARFTRNSIDKKKPLVDTQYGIFDKTEAPRQFSTHHQPRTPSRQTVTEPERFCPCTDPLLPFPEGNLPHQYICQVNTDSLPGEVCRERGFRMDNPPLRPSLARLVEVVAVLLRFPRAAYL
jgi:hypothetical protein